MKNTVKLDFRYAQESIDDDENAASDSRDIFECLFVHRSKVFSHVGIFPLIQLSPLQVLIFNSFHYVFLRIR